MKSSLNECTEIKMGFLRKFVHAFPHCFPDTGPFKKGRHLQNGNFRPSLPALSLIVTSMSYLPPSLFTGQIVTNFDGQNEKLWEAELIHNKVENIKFGHQKYSLLRAAP